MVGHGASNTTEGATGSATLSLSSSESDIVLVTKSRSLIVASILSLIRDDLRWYRNLRDDSTLDRDLLGNQEGTCFEDLVSYPWEEDVAVFDGGARELESEALDSIETVVS